MFDVYLQNLNMKTSIFVCVLFFWHGQLYITPYQVEKKGNGHDDMTSTTEKHGELPKMPTSQYCKNFSS